MRAKSSVDAGSIWSCASSAMVIMLPFKTKPTDDIGLPRPRRNPDAYHRPAASPFASVS